MGKRSVLGALAAAMLLAGCERAKEMAGSLGELQAVAAAVARSLDHPGIHVDLANGRFMSISVVDAPLGSLPKELRAAKALEIARLAYRSFASRASLERVAVSFVEHKSYLVLNVDHTTDAYQFSPAELAGESEEQSTPRGTSPP